jgi:hypothetical protein
MIRGALLVTIAGLVAILCNACARSTAPATTLAGGRSEA